MAVLHSKDNRILTSSNDNSAIIWDFYSGEIIEKLGGHTSGISELKCQTKNDLLIIPENDFPSLWKIENGKNIFKISQSYDTIIHTSSSPMGQSIITISRNGLARIWDAKSGKIKFSIENVRKVRYSPNGELILIEYRNYQIRLLKVDDGHFLNFKASTKSGTDILSFSSDGNNILIIEGHYKRNIPKLYRVNDGKVIVEYKKSKENGFDSPSFSTDGKSLLTISLKNTLDFWDLKTDKLLYSFNINERIRTINLSPSGKFLGVISDTTLNILDVRTGVVIIKLKILELQRTFMNFSLDEKTFLVFNGGNSISLWDLNKKTKIEELKGHDYNVSSASYIECANVLTTTSEDGSFILWNAHTGEQLIRHFIYDSDPSKWLHIHPSGLFDASPEAMEMMYWTKGLEVIEFAQLKDRNWVPGLWEKVMKGEPLPDVRNMQELKLQPQVKFGEVKDGKIPVVLTKRDGGYGKVSIFINGKEVISDARGGDMDTTLAQQTLYFDVTDHPYLVNGENEIMVKASSADGFVEGRGELLKMVAKKVEAAKPSFYGVVIGVGDYVNDKIDLKFPVKDAEAVSVAMNLGAKNLFGADKTFMYSVTSGDAKRPTKATISAVFDEIAAKAQAQDVIMIYLSGHGVTWGGDQGDFYFLTADATAANKDAYNDPVIRQNNTISTAEWVELLKKIPALKQVMIIDACGSGKAVDNLIAARDIESSQIKAIDRMKDRTGMYIISGCTADAVSYEASQYGQGLLTYSILEAMKGAAIRPDGSVDLSLMMQHARDRVPVLAAGLGGIQEPQILSPKGGSIDIGILSEADRKLIPLASPKKVFVRSYLVEKTKFRDVLNLSTMLNNELSTLTSKGSEANIIFFNVDEYGNSCQITGGYTSGANGIDLDLVLVCDGKETTQRLSAKTAEELVKQIVEFVNR